MEDTSHKELTFGIMYLSYLEDMVGVGGDTYSCFQLSEKVI